ncbi:MAG: AAA family ATPase [Chthoniobacter sp.]|nr:AAA family ATPase [Chthoniobacter sp.]
MSEEIKSLVANTPFEPTVPLRALDLDELLSLELPPREFVLSPWLPSQGLALLYAFRGVGKTQVALGIAHAVASGGQFLNWNAPKPRRVLYLDGEMPLISMQQRLARIVRMAEVEPPAPDYLKLVSPDLQDRSLTLSNEEGQKRLEPLLTNVSLVIVDNISTLANLGRENESESWLPLQEWALGLRRRGVSVLFIHHAGKGGAQRGTSRREDVLDAVLVLRHPKDFDPRQGARFEIHYEKARHLVGDDTAPLCAHLTDSGWDVRALEDERDCRILSLHAEGLSQTEIAVELEVNKSTISRALKRLVSEGKCS